MQEKSTFLRGLRQVSRDAYNVHSRLLALAVSNPKMPTLALMARLLDEAIEAAEVLDDRVSGRIA